MRTQHSSRRHPRTPITDPNVIERAAIYLSLAELLDPAPVRHPAPIAPRAARKPAP